MNLSAAIRREYVYLKHIVRTLWLLRTLKADSTHTIVDIVEAQARRRPRNVALIYEDIQLTYAQMDARANRYARWAMAQAIAPGACVALMMENRPDYICAWLGLFKAGIQAALINTNLKGEGLAHSIAICGARHAIVGAELAERIRAAPFAVFTKNNLLSF